MFVVRSFRAGRMVGRIGVSEPREARAEVARLIAEPREAPDRVTVWRDGPTCSRQVADVRLEVGEDFMYPETPFMINEGD